MRYIALLRGINVGTSVRVQMKQLKESLQTAGFERVSSYINSGNVLLDSNESAERTAAITGRILFEMTGCQIPVLVKEASEIVALNKLVPEEWTNDEVQRTDVVFTLGTLDSETIAGDLPVNRNYVQLLVGPGMLVWNYKREHATKTRLNKIMAKSWYPLVTIRNINTLRYLAAAAGQ